MIKNLSLASELPLDKHTDAEILAKMEIEIAGQRKILKALHEVAEKLASDSSSAKKKEADR
jgi:hypothetical protein